MDNEPILELKGISKRFGETRALHQVGLTLQRGEVRALIGENGAGKSTLMKILSGAYRMDEGEIRVKGQARSILSPLDARALGIAMIYQELNLAPHLSVGENITLGLEKSAWGLVRNQREKIRGVLDLLGHPEIPLDSRVSSLSIGLQQLVEIARALLSEASVIIMDEPTSSLTASDTRTLFAAIRRLKESGISFVYISHFLEEVREIADSFTVLRDGELAGEGKISGATIPQLIRMMVGRPLNEMFPKSSHALGERVLKVEGAEGKPLPKGVSFELHQGEILGLAGLVGSGRSETLRSLFGLQRAQKGGLDFRGKSLELSQMTPPRALGLKMDFLSENRKEEGLATGMSIGTNLTLSSLGRFVRWKGWGPLGLQNEKDRVSHWITELGIRCEGPVQVVRNLSGGNQQKVAMARLLEQGGDVLLLDEPTRGVDVGSKVEIYRLVQRLAAQGKAIVFVSSYLPELLGVCDTLAVMHRGRLSPAKPVDQWSEEEIMRVATSGQY